MGKWQHTDVRCDDRECYCLGDDASPDPMCDGCGKPAWACECETRACDLCGEPGCRCWLKVEEKDG